MIARAQTLMEKIIMARKADPALPAADTHWQNMTKAEKLSAATDLALGIVHQILELGIDARDVKLLSQVKDTALSIISQQIRVDEGGLRPDRLAAERERALARLVQKLPERFRPRVSGGTGSDLPTALEAAEPHAAETPRKPTKPK
jgi:hypothetical protein